jgi:hypothetical protein
VGAQNQMGTQVKCIAAWLQVATARRASSTPMMQLDRTPVPGAAWTSGLCSTV